METCCRFSISQDLGHGPFSHVFDTKMKTKLIEYHQSEIEKLSHLEYKDAKMEKRLAYHLDLAEKLNDWEHEDASCKMFDYMLDNTEGLKDAFEKKNLKRKERKLIKDLIKGNGEVPVTEDGKKYSKWFLFEIVANKVNEIDCDKFDYFARDCHNLGMKSNFDHLRYIHNIRILPKVESNELHLCVRDKLVFNIYELFHTRWSLHHRAYQHKTTKAIEEMITDAFVLLEEKYKFSEAIFNMEEYAKLSDSIFYEILRSSDTDENTKKAQEILRRIQQRKLYKLYHQFQPSQKLQIDGLKAAEEIASLSKGRVNPNEIFVNTVNIHFGQKEKDPVKSVLFYQKNGEIVDQISADDVSRMLPRNFSEQYVRVYGKNRFKKEKIAIVVDCFKEWREKQEDKLPEALTVMALSGIGALAATYAFSKVIGL